MNKKLIFIAGMLATFSCKSQNMDKIIISNSEGKTYYFDDMRYIDDNLVAVKLNKDWGVMERFIANDEIEAEFSTGDSGLTYGKVVTAIKYDEVGDICSGLILVQLKGVWGFIDERGKEVFFFPKYDKVDYFRQDGLCIVGLNKKYGFIDRTGKEIIPLKYDRAYSFYKGTATVLYKGVYGFVDKVGNEYLFPQYDTSSYLFEDDLCPVSSKGKWGYINKKGIEVIPLKYNECKEFSEGLAAVKLNNKWGFINKENEIVIPIIYDRVNKIYDGKVVVDLNEEKIRLSKDGKRIDN